MRSGLFALTALLLSTAPTLAADPPIVFQVQPLGRVLDDLRTAANLVGGEKAVMAVNKKIKDTFGEKGLEGFDIGRPIVGYVILTPKVEDTTAVIALPITGEKEFLDLFERATGEKPAVDPKDKTLYSLPAPGQAKALMRFSNQYAYIAFGMNPEAHIEAKALVPMPNLFDPAERGLVAARLYFDRIPDGVRKVASELVEDVKKKLTSPGGLGRGFGIGQQEMQLLKPAMVEIDNLVDRYMKLAAGADVLAARLYLDPQAGNFVAEAALTGKPLSDLSKSIAAYKNPPNKFAALASHPDTVVGFKTRLPLFEPELRAAAAVGLDAMHKEFAKNAPEVGKAALEELFKGLIRTAKTGEFDIAMGVRGPDKDGWFTMVGAVAFEDPAALETEFKKFVLKQAPQDVVDAIKWDAAKAGNVSIHTWTMKPGGFSDPSKVFGGDNCIVSFAFAPHGIFAAMGPDSVSTIKDAIAVKPVGSPDLDVVLNPARMRKFIHKIAPDDRETPMIEDLFGKEDKLGSVASVTVEGGKELKLRFTMDLRVLPRMVLMAFMGRPAFEDVPVPEKK
jgi:hypothetical protein